MNRSISSAAIRLLFEKLSISCGVEYEQNCGLSRECPKNSFPVYLTTGNVKDRKAKLCVSGNYIIKPDFLEDVRGLNGAIIESKNFEVISVRNFDTFMSNKSGAISEWVDIIMENDILIMFTCHKASERLTGTTRQKLNSLGSGKVQNLQFGSQWYMITQKALSGFTTYEKISHSKNGEWGETLEFKGCIPRRIPKEPITADDPIPENEKKVHFCSGKVSDKYKGFCNEPRFQMLTPALLTNKTLIGNPVYTFPIFLFASKDIEFFLSAVDNLMHQPGIIATLVHVFYENKMDDVPAISKIYGARFIKINFEKTFENRIHQARELSSKMYPNKKYLIVLDSDVLPSPDFLSFFAQMMEPLQKDNSLKSISAWSLNCYQHDGNVELAYRVQGIPKYGALLSTNDSKIYGDLCAPDVSRVQGMEACHTPSLNGNNYINRPQDLTREGYYPKLIMLQRLSSIIDFNEVLVSCSPAALKDISTIIYIDKKEKIPKLMKCLGIKKNKFGVFDGIIRLFVKGKSIIIVTKDSFLFKSRPLLNSNNSVST